MRALLICLALLMSAVAAGAIEPERREVVVVKVRAWDGYNYVETFLPSTNKELTLIAGEDSAISFVRTEEYYWPLSRQVYVDLNKRQETVEGVLRIERDGKLAAEETWQTYSIVYPTGAINGNGSLLWGEDAEAAFAAYQQGEREFSRRYVEALGAQTRYERDLIRAGARRSDGGPIEAVAAPPPLPQADLRLVTRPTGALRVSLGPGVYRMALWRDGEKVAGTERSLRVIDPARRTSVVADIIPEERWTRPIATNSSSARIFVTPGTTFYLTLAEASRFDEAEYLPVVSPQAAAVEGRTLWVRRKPHIAEAVSLKAGGDATSLLFDRLKVEQTQGAAFGYQVRQARDGETPDLSAFAVKVPDDASVDGMWIGLPDQPFEREVVIVRPRNWLVSLSLCLVPLAAALAFSAMRRRAALAA